MAGMAMMAQEGTNGAVDAVSSAAIRVPTEDATLLDEVLSGVVAGYDRTYTVERVGWIADAAAKHIERCELYARLAASKEFNPKDVVAAEDLANVPILPSSIFKKRKVCSDLHGEVLECRSSGTQGIESIVLRDQPTMERFVAGLLHGAAEFYDRYEVREAFVLGPPTEEAGSLWFAYVLGLLDLAFDTNFFVHSDEFQPEELASRLSSMPPGTQPVIVGPPALIVDFCRWIESSPISVSLAEKEALIATAGGWKSRAQDQIDRDEFTRLVVDTFDIRPAAVRDLFNMVELNTVLFECDYKSKHVPPWLEVIVRRAADMSVASPGEEGVLTYLDPTATSYPCFILSDDIGSLSGDPCGCGRAGRTVSLSRRLNNIEERGCALKMERYGRKRR